MKNLLFTEIQLNEIAGDIFGSLKSSGMDSREIVRIVSMLTTHLTDDIKGKCQTSNEIEEHASIGENSYNLSA